MAIIPGLTQNLTITCIFLKLKVLNLLNVDCQRMLQIIRFSNVRRKFYICSKNCCQPFYLNHNTCRRCSILPNSCYTKKCMWKPTKITVNGATAIAVTSVVLTVCCGFLCLYKKVKISERPSGKCGSLTKNPGRPNTGKASNRLTGMRLFLSFMQIIFGFFLNGSTNFYLIGIMLC